MEDLDEGFYLLQIMFRKTSLFEDFAQRAFWKISCVMRNHGTSFDFRMIEDIVATRGMIKEETFSFEESDYFLWRKTPQFRHKTMSVAEKFFENLWRK